MNDEGYIKFKANWAEVPLFQHPSNDNFEARQAVEKLNEWRQKLFQFNLIGAYPDGIGFGNVSHRASSNEFYISGSKTGNLEFLTVDHYSKVTAFDISKNRIDCIGPIIASSESMSHAVIFQELGWVQAVFHVHHLQLWEAVLHKIPTTSACAKYGTPEMAKEIIRLIKESNVTEKQVFAMAGHQEGLFAFGRDLAETGSLMFELMDSIV